MAREDIDKHLLRRLPSLRGVIDQNNDLGLFGRQGKEGRDDNR